MFEGEEDSKLLELVSMRWRSRISSKDSKGGKVNFKGLGFFSLEKIVVKNVFKFFCLYWLVGDMVNFFFRVCDLLN